MSQGATLPLYVTDHLGQDGHRGHIRHADHTLEHHYGADHKSGHHHDGSIVIDLEAAPLRRSNGSDGSGSDSPGGTPLSSCRQQRRAAAESPRTRQAALDALMNTVDGDEGPTYYSFPSLVSYLTCGPAALVDGAFCDALRAVSKKILNTAGAPVYLADGKAYMADVLADEFPELTLFRITLDEAFVESRVHRGLWVETQRFADLHSLSRMRRELKKTGLANGFKAAEIVKVLLGIEPIRH